MAGVVRESTDSILARSLAGGASHAEAAAEAGCSERTVYRRAADPNFLRKVAEVRNKLLGQAVGRLAANGTLAVNILVGVAGTAEADAVRVSACRAILDFMFRGAEHVDFNQRLCALEERLAQP